MRNKRIIKTSLLCLSLFALGFSLLTISKEANNNNGVLISNEYESGPVFYAADYVSDFTSEPSYSTQNGYTYSCMNTGQIYKRFRGDSVKVAVIDSGINYEHEDFMLNSNSIVKSVSRSIEYNSGWYYYEYSNNASHLSDSLGHGTNVASVIASQINSVGCAGLAPNIELYVYKVTNSSNGYEWIAIQNALQYCIDNDIDVINMSFQAYENAVSYNGSSMGASSGCSSVLTTAINNCYNAGITLVAAAGNYNTNEPSYPASNNHVISVGSLAESSTTTKAGYSNTYGIDLVAPGTVYVADKGTSSSYKKTQGTSFSAPIVTAAIALYKQKYPSATPSEIETALYNSCDAISGNPSWAGNGRLNLCNFLNEPTYYGGSVNSISLNNISNDLLELEVGDTFDIDYTVNGTGDYSTDVSYELMNDDGTLSIDNNGRITALSEGEELITIRSEEDHNVTAVFEVDVSASSVTLSSISVSGQTTEFDVGDTFSFGGTVTAHFSNGSSSDVTSLSTFSGYDMSSSGTQTVTVSYGGKTTTYSITVNAIVTTYSFSHSYTYSEQGTGNGKTWSLTNGSDSLSYWLCPTGSEPSVALIPGVFDGRDPVSIVTITIECATYGSGTNPSASTFSIYNSAACTTEVASVQSGTLPTSSTYTNVVYTISQNNANTYFTTDLAIKITKPGKQIRLKTITISFDYQEGALAPTLSSITLDTTNVNKTFVLGDTFSYSGLVVTAHYSDNSSETINSGYTVSSPVMTSTGNKTITVTYNGKEATYDITVNDGTLSSISVSGQTTSYARGSSFSFDGTCIATFANGYQVEVTPTNVSSPDMSTSGTKTITVTYTYNGVTKTTTYDITVNAYRTVMEETYSVIGTITYPGNTQTISVNTLSVSTSGSKTLESNSIRLGSSDKTGSLTITSTTSNIRKVVVSAKAYSSDADVHLTIGGSDNIITSSYADYVKEYATAVNSVTIATTASKKRAHIQSVTVYTKSSEDIGQTDDCIGLETFINNYMHMDYTNNLGYCKDNEHHYYSSAKAAFNALNDHQRAVFTTNTAYSLEWNRLRTWASINGDSLNENDILAQSMRLANSIIVNNDTLIIVLLICSLLSISTIASYIVIKRKRI